VSSVGTLFLMITAKPLAGKVAVVTGGARGIGRAIAIELARAGAHVSICDKIGEDGAAGTIAGIEETGQQSLFFNLDIADRAAVERMMSDTERRWGRIDILVNNAGRNIRKPLIDLEPTDVEAVWSVLLWGAFHATQLAARSMVARGEGGNIVNISSVHASKPFPNSTAYNGAKAAVNHMSRTWAAELARYRIRVNVIEPGWINTPGERDHYTEDEIRERGAALPFGRLGSPEEIARAVKFLVSDEASYVTGACLRVDGGIILPV
jgi:glucose 1-dehydrogenase